MGPLLILLALMALAWLVVGPILCLVLLHRVREVEAAVELLRRERTAERLADAARKRSAEAPPPVATSMPHGSQPARAPAMPQAANLEEFLQGAPAARTRPAPAASPRPSPAEPREPERSFWDDMPVSLEEIVAGKWMAWVGAVALVIGAGFFFKYAIEQGWIGPERRVLMGVISGIACFGGGVYAMRRGYRFLAEGLVGAALGILYFSLFAASKWFDPPVLSLNLSFIGMCLATAAALAFAGWFNAQPAAVLGLIGGFLTPVMLSRGVDERWVFFSYLLMLDLGALAVASFRHWPKLNLLAFGGTLLMWLGWFAQHYDHTKLLDAVILMTCFFAVFAVLGVWHHVIRRTAANPEDFAIIFAAPVAYFAGLYYVTDAQHAHLHGLLAVTVAAVYAVLTLATLQRAGTDRKIAFGFGGLAVTFVTLAAPLQWSGHWVTIAWAVESLILFEMGLRFGEPKLSRAGLALLGVVQLILVAYAMTTFADPEHFSTEWRRRIPGEAASTTAAAVADPHWSDLLNGRSFSFLAAIAVMAIMAWESSRRRFDPEPDPRRTGPQTTGDWLLAGSVIAALLLLVVETFSMWSRLDGLVPTFASFVAVEAALIGLALIVCAASIGPRWLDRLGLAALALCGGALLVSFIYTLIHWRADWNSLAANETGLWGLLLVNPRGLGFLISLAAAGIAAAVSMRSRRRHPDHGSELDIGGLLGLEAIVMGVVWLTAEAYAWGVMHDWQTKTSLAVTLVWTLYALAVLIAGISLRSGGLRKLALLLIVLTTSKVFLFDVWQLDIAIRTFAFVALGIALLLVSWLYRRHRDRLREWMKPDQRPAVG